MEGQRRKAGRHPANQLTATRVAKLTQPGRYFDGVGLYLRIIDNGTKTWIQKLTVCGKQTTLGHGGYPAVSLAEARKRALEAQAPSPGLVGILLTEAYRVRRNSAAAIDAVVALNK